jgi:phage head maturation protease
MSSILFKGSIETLPALEKAAVVVVQLEKFTQESRWVNKAAQS